MSQPGTHSYVFVRFDLSLEQTIIQTNHATHAMAYGLSQSPDDVVPHIVLIGVPNQKSLEKVVQKLHYNHIDFSSFDEPDNDLGLTAVATVPLAGEQRDVLANYKIWTEEEFLHARSSVG